MKHLMRDIAKLRRLFGHPLRESLSPEGSEGTRFRAHWALCLTMLAEEFIELLEATLGSTSDNDELRQVDSEVGRLIREFSGGAGPANVDMVAAGDALIDIMVLTVGLGIGHGYPLDVMWDEVQRSNLEKCVEGKVLRREDGKILKPEGWQPPRMAEAVCLPSAAWANTEEEDLLEVGIRVPRGQDPFKTLLERYNALSSLHERTVGFSPEVSQLRDEILETNLQMFQHRNEDLREQGDTLHNQCAVLYRLLRSSGNGA